MRRFLILTFIFLGCGIGCMAQNWDINTVHKVNSWDGKFIKNASSFISKTEPYVAIGVPLVMGLVGTIRKDKALQKDAIYVGASVAGSFALALGMKHIFNRERPYVAYPDMVNPHSLGDGPSFPSGHTASAFALATSLSMRYPKWYVIGPSALWACSVGMSRIYEGVHYPTDVLAGAALGIGTSFLSVYVSRQLSKWLLGY